MAESAKVRLVRCPKCENLLPELPDYSVYQCGGCGAVLRAKKGDLEGDKVSERSNEGRVRVVAEKPDKLSDRSENFRGKETVSGVENRVEEGVSDSERSGEIIAERHGNDTKDMTDQGIVENDCTRKNEIGYGKLQSNADELKTQVGNANESRSSGQIFRRRTLEKREVKSFGRVRRGDLEAARIPKSNFTGEGTSTFRGDCNFRNVRTLKNQSDTNRSNRVEHIEANREELLRKLDELKDQLSRTCDVNDITKERILLGQRIPCPESCADSDDWFHDLSSGFHRGSRQNYAPNMHAARSHCFDRYHDPLSIANRSNMTISDYHHSMQNLNHIVGFEGSFPPHLPRRPHRIPTQHQHQVSRTYLSGHHISPELDHFEQQLYNANLDELSCSCYQCRDKHQQVSVQLPSTAFCNTRFPYVSNKPFPCHHEMPGFFDSQGYNSGNGNLTPVASYDPQAHARWPTDHNIELDGFAHSRPQRVVVANGGRHCHPVAGGAPLITCSNCFELLKLPKKAFHLEKSQYRICCGACSSVISLAVVDGKLVSVDMPTKRTPKESLDSSNEVAYEKPYKSCDALKLDSSSFHSEDYDNPGFDFQPMDKEPASSATCQGLSSSKSEELQNLCSLSPSTFDDEDCPEDFVSGHGVIAAEMPVKDTVSPPPYGSPLEDNFDFSAKYRAVNRCGKGNLSSRSDQEKFIPNKSILRQNSLKESLETELEISHNDCSSIGVTKNSADATKEDVQPRGKRGVDSFLTGLIKKSFRDFSRSTQAAENGKRNVTVNGRVVPEQLVKKAEKLAGPIYPGHYWYDFRAGFWGAIGGPCLGIIPPYIEEFNFPMPENCAGGNTGVFVNGRELHQKDLDLLASRGLPATGERSYIIEISGRVLDENSGEELDSLGKLAPTVEKVKHGFGMRFPKQLHK
ncbi:hypothetical protein Nepgr_002276 [Nepenthes gracilis]|uniref:Zinc-ribbon domain-containing protein n=1 Tax=Nepenthes gracilis TaxID=150966 RepID=A0AAD3RWR2_NEPGR|nr:hypothetical protein Nepgr_002276 [Nepenthes gracilis]